MGAAAAIIGGAAISAVGSGIAANKQAKGQEQARQQQLAAIEQQQAVRQGLIAAALSGDFNGFGVDEIFGTAVQPTDTGQSQLQAILNNIQNFEQIDNFTQTANDAISRDSLDRANAFDPNFSGNVSELSDQARSFLRGELPEDVFDFTVRDRAGRTAATGIPGTGGAATARDLGLTTLDLQSRGLSIFQQINSIREQADPISRRLSQTKFLLDPTTQIQVDQANALINAQPDPTAAGLFALELQGGISNAVAGGQATIPVNLAGTNAARAFGAGISQAGITAAAG